MWLSLWRKTFFVNIYHFYWFDQKELFNVIQSFLRIFPFQTEQEKQTIWVFSMLVSEIVTSMSKIKSYL